MLHIHFTVVDHPTLHSKVSLTFQLAQTHTLILFSLKIIMNNNNDRDESMLINIFLYIGMVQGFILVHSLARIVHKEFANKISKLRAKFLGYRVLEISNFVGGFVSNFGLERSRATVELIGQHSNSP